MSTHGHDDMHELTPQPDMVKAVCWECGQDVACIEYVVCCTGSLFHICPACEQKAEDREFDAVDMPSADPARADA